MKVVLKKFYFWLYKLNGQARPVLQVLKGQVIFLLAFQIHNWRLLHVPGGGGEGGGGPKSRNCQKVMHIVGLHHQRACHKRFQYIGGFPTYTV